MLQSSPGYRSGGRMLLSPQQLLRVVAGCMLLALLYSPVEANSQSKPGITLNSNRISLKRLFEEIKRQTDYDVLYNPELVDTAAQVSVNARNMPLDDLLSDLLRQRSLSYSLINTTIVIENRKRPVPAAVAAAPPAEEPLRGVVVEEKSRTPLFGVSVVVKRTGKGTQTNAQGRFELKEFTGDDSLVFSIIGYQSSTIAVASLRRAGIVALKLAVNELDEAIVQAYGVTSRRLTTGSTVKISGEEISRQPMQNPLLALQGRVPGMSITPTSAYSNAPVKVEIRGRNSVNRMGSGEPLYIIDGIPQTVLGLNNPAVQLEGVSSGLVQAGISYSFGQSPLFGINQYDIESIEVLKDADATAIYGSRGANGVVIITTKRPRVGKASYTFNISQGISSATRLPKLLDPSTYYMIRREALKNDGIEITPVTAPDLVLWDTTRYTDWQKDYYGTGRNTQVSASVSGGDQHSKFGLSTNYSRETGMNSYSGASEVFGITLRSDLSSKDRKLNIGTVVDYKYTFADAIQSVPSTGLPPNAPPMLDEEGKPNFAGWELPDNHNRYPWGSVFKRNETRTNVLSGAVNLGYILMQGLDVSVNIGYRHSISSSDIFLPLISQNPRENPLAISVFGTTKANALTIKPQLNYRRFISKGNLNVTIGAEGIREITSGTTATGSGYTNDELIHSLNNAPTVMVSDAYVQRRYIGVVARLNYNWKNKYIITINANRDGSSQFGPGRQFGNYGALGLSWNASEEKWIQQIMPSWVNFIKLIANYGLTGSNNVGDYQYLSQWSSRSGNSQLHLYNGLRPFVPVHPVNQDYHWETTRQLSTSAELLADPALQPVLQEQAKGKLSYAAITAYDLLFRVRVKNKLEALLQQLYFLDVCMSVASVARKRGFVFPKAMEKGKMHLLLKGLYHPQLQHPVGNDFTMSSNRNLIFLTGANMAGKSTFLRAVSTALYLAHMGFPVAASQMEFSVMDAIYTTINLPDNLGIGASHFYAEVLRVKKVAAELNAGKSVFVIFDELFRGTNVKDAHEATVDISKAFAGRKNSLFIISSHIVEAGVELQKVPTIGFQFLPTRMKGHVPEYTYTLEEGITEDRHGMIIIRNEGVLDILKHGRKKAVLQQA